MILHWFKRWARPLIFLFVVLIHAAALFCVHFSSAPADTISEKEAEVFKLVDVEEYVPPPPPPPPDVKVQQVVYQPKASETVQETEEQIIELPENMEPVYLPQHKISSAPVIPAKEILSKIEYPQMAMRQGIEGVVYLELYIDRNGEIRRTDILKDPGYGFAEAALAALNGIVCRPALANGNPCAVRFRYPVRFTLH